MDASDMTLWIVTVINAAFVALLCTPLLSYHLYKFYLRRHEIFIAKRYPTLVIITNSLICIGTPVIITFTLIKNVSPAQTNNPLLFNICGRMNLILACTITSTINCLLLSRFWLMFYNLNYSKSNINAKWKSYLDPSLVSKDFWLKYKTKLGSPRSVTKISCFLILIVSVPRLIYAQLYFPPKPGYIIYGTLPIHLLFVTAYITLAIRAPHVYDLFHLRFELKSLVTILLLSIFIIYGFQPLINSSNCTIQLIAKLIRNNVAIGAYTLMGFTSTWFILHKIDSKFHKGYSKQLQRHNYVELQRVLLDAHNFELFAQHLAREFSIDTMLAFIEFVQFKHVIDNIFHLNVFVGSAVPQHELIDDEMENTEIYFDYRSCDITCNTAIPKSVIVYRSDYGQTNVNDLTPFLRIAHELYEKYIKIGVELEINISSQSRECYMNDMGCSVEAFIDKQLNCDTPMETVDLFEYFDSTIEEMYCLLTSICDRFLETDENVNIARIHLTGYDTNQIEDTFHGMR